MTKDYIKQYLEETISIAQTVSQEEIEKGISGQQHIENMIDMSLKNLGIVVYASVDSSASITSL